MHPDHHVAIHGQKPVGILAQEEESHGQDGEEAEHGQTHRPQGGMDHGCADQGQADRDDEQHQCPAQAEAGDQEQPAVQPHPHLQDQGQHPDDQQQVDPATPVHPGDGTASQYRDHLVHRPEHHRGDPAQGDQVDHGHGFGEEWGQKDGLALLDQHGTAHHQEKRCRGKKTQRNIQGGGLIHV